MIDSTINWSDYRREAGAMMIVDKIIRRWMMGHNGRDKSGPYPTGNKLPD
jgi:hypothetical protein